jgi:hypothetical protein
MKNTLAYFATQSVTKKKKGFITLTQGLVEVETSEVKKLKSK